MFFRKKRTTHQLPDRDFCICLKALTLDGFTQVFLDILLQSQAPDKKLDRKQKICWEGKGTSKWQTSWVTSNDRNVGVQSFMLDELVKICWRMWFKHQIYLGH